MNHPALTARHSVPGLILPFPHAAPIVGFRKPVIYQPGGGSIPPHFETLNVEAVFSAINTAGECARAFGTTMPPTDARHHNPFRLAITPAGDASTSPSGFKATALAEAAAAGRPRDSRS